MLVPGWSSNLKGPGGEETTAPGARAATFLQVFNGGRRPSQFLDSRGSTFMCFFLSFWDTHTQEKRVHTYLWYTYMIILCNMYKA